MWIWPSFSWDSCGEAMQRSHPRHRSVTRLNAPAFIRCRSVIFSLFAKITPMVWDSHNLWNLLMCPRAFHLEPFFICCTLRVRQISELAGKANKSFCHGHVEPRAHDRQSETFFGSPFAASCTSPAGQPIKMRCSEAFSFISQLMRIAY